MDYIGFQCKDSYPDRLPAACAARLPDRCPPAFQAGPERERTDPIRTLAPQRQRREGGKEGEEDRYCLRFPPPLPPSLSALRPTTINFPPRSGAVGSAVGCDSGPSEGRGKERGRRRARSRTRGRTIIQHGSGSKPLRSSSVRPTTCSLHAGQTCRVSARASCIFGNSCGFHYGEDRKVSNELRALASRPPKYVYSNSQRPNSMSLPDGAPCDSCVQIGQG